MYLLNIYHVADTMPAPADAVVDKAESHPHEAYSLQPTMCAWSIKL